MTKIITYFCCALSFGVFAQTENVISTGGSYQQSAQGSITWTIGEVVINTVESPDVHLTQGFNQDWLHFLNIETFVEKINITVFPNPTTQYINIESDKKSDLKIYDASSKIVKDLKIEKQDQVDLSDLSPGIYYLEFTRKNKKIKTIKIIIQ